MKINMNRHVIVGRLGTNDILPLPLAVGEQMTEIDLLDSASSLKFGIGQALNDLAKIGVIPSEIGLDLLILASLVQAADILISREHESQDSWTREIRLIVPVSDISIWQRSNTLLTRILNFLTGDIWKINFRLRPSEFKELVPNSTPVLDDMQFNTVSLFSGGLDSLIGAVDILESKKAPLFISHSNEGSISDAQKKCFDGLKKRYKNLPFDRLRIWLSFPGMKINNRKHEMTTRGRSFLFFSLAVFAGTGFNKEFTVNVPENGLIALNIPLDSLRLGSNSTRTTHPFYIARWNEFIHTLGINGHIKNPYWNKTKGEMVSECKNKKLLKELFPQTLSCSSPTKGHYHGIGTQHCGYCLPCLIRRAAINSGFGKGSDTTIYTVNDLHKKVLSTLQAEGKQIRSFQFAINRLQKNPNLAKLLIHKSGSLADVAPEDKQTLSHVYLKGMNEVSDILNNVQTEPK